MSFLTLARNAMNTRFELVLHGENEASLQAAGEEALAEVARLENQLSLFRPSTEIALVNARAAREPVRVSPEVFALLEHAQQLSRETNGAFDITTAPLLRCWGLLGRSDGHIPSAEEIAAARAIVGTHLVELDRDHFTVRFAKPDVMLDLGAIGKGYAVEMAADTLREAGITSALIHGGTSTAYAIGTPPNADTWKIAIETPAADVRSMALTPPSEPAAGGNPNAPLAVIPLRDEALSVSAVSSKCFQAGDRTFGHVIDPRTGQPASCALLTAVVLPSGTETDALSTALLVVGEGGHHTITALRPGMRMLVASATGDGRIRTITQKIELCAAKTVS